MQLVGLGVAKNEGDVIGDSIDHALGVCDLVVYLDNGSEDDTWDVIRSRAAANPGRVVAFGQIDEPFTNYIRHHIYDAYRTEVDPGAWWMKLDADEFIAEDPRPVVEAAAAAGADAVRAWHAQFQFTDRDVADWEQGRERLELPITERRRYYRCDWREIHLWRNEPNQDWLDQTRQVPLHVQRIHRRTVMNRHYQYRTPEQIERRLAVRLGHAQFGHVRSADWRSVVVPSSSCHEARPGRPLEVDRWDFYSHRIREEIARRRPGSSPA